MELSTMKSTKPNWTLIPLVCFPFLATACIDLGDRGLEPDTPGFEIDVKALPEFDEEPPRTFLWPSEQDGSRFFYGGGKVGMGTSGLIAIKLAETEIGVTEFCFAEDAPIYPSTVDIADLRAGAETDPPLAIIKAGTCYQTIDF